MKKQSPFLHPVTELISKRFSCRTYQSQMLAMDQQRYLLDILAKPQIGPLGNRANFEFVAASLGDSKALRGLGTYGFIKNAAAYIVGVTIDTGKGLEDFGYLMQKLILYATDQDLGTCWLGGSFNRSRFARKINLREGYIIPAVTALGYIAEKPGRVDTFIRKEARGDQRRPWNWMFFDGEFGNPLSELDAAEYAIPLEMVRLAPSASNLQPWRIIKLGRDWHFYLQRKPGYRDSRSSKFLQTADLQRVDLGIAMCHFELTAHSLGVTGCWEDADPDIWKPNEFTEYTCSWIG